MKRWLFCIYFDTFTKGEIVMNRQRRQMVHGVSVFYAQVIITVLMLGLFFILPMYSQVTYEQSSSFLSETLQKNTGVKQINVLQSVISAVKQVKQPTEEARGRSITSNQLFENSELPKGKALTPIKSKKVTSDFGWRAHPITGKDDFHTGVDIAAPKGTEITAPFDGVVTLVNLNDRIYGKCLQIKGGEMTVFLAHCDDINVKKDQAVSAGEVVAFVGTTGMSTGYHLHLECIVNDVRVNPLTYIKL